MAPVPGQSVLFTPASPSNILAVPLPDTLNTLAGLMQLLSMRTGQEPGRGVEMWNAEAILCLPKPCSLTSFTCSTSLDATRGLLIVSWDPCHHPLPQVLGQGAAASAISLHIESMAVTYTSRVALSPLPPWRKWEAGQRKDTWSRPLQIKAREKNKMLALYFLLKLYLSELFF